MESPYYSLVAYVSNPVGQFVESLRRELQPEQGHLPAHLTVLPPRQLNFSAPPLCWTTHRGTS